MANPELREQLEQAIGANKVLLLMKGTPEEPRCGFSMRAVGILEQMGTEYGAIDVLPVLQPLREVTTEIADWGTFPQLYVDGDLLGGADLMEEMFESGELATTLGVEQPAGPTRSARDPPVRAAVPEQADADRDLKIPPSRCSADASALLGRRGVAARQGRQAAGGPGSHGNRALSGSGSSCSPAVIGVRR